MRASSVRTTGARRRSEMSCGRTGIQTSVTVAHMGAVRLMVAACAVRSTGPPVPPEMEFGPKPTSRHTPRARRATGSSVSPCSVEAASRAAAPLAASPSSAATSLSSLVSCLSSPLRPLAILSVFLSFQAALGGKFVPHLLTRCPLTHPAAQGQRADVHGVAHMGVVTGTARARRFPEDSASSASTGPLRRAFPLAQLLQHKQRLASTCASAAADADPEMQAPSPRAAQAARRSKPAAQVTCHSPVPPRIGNATIVRPKHAASVIDLARVVACMLPQQTTALSATGM